MIEIQLAMSTVSGVAPFVMLSLVETALDVLVSSSISTDGAAEMGKSIGIREFVIIILDWSCVDS